MPRPVKRLLCSAAFAAVGALSLGALAFSAPSASAEYGKGICWYSDAHAVRYSFEGTEEVQVFVGVKRDAGTVCPEIKGAPFNVEITKSQPVEMIACNDWAGIVGGSPGGWSIDSCQHMSDNTVYGFYKIKRTGKIELAFAGDIENFLA